MNQVNKYSVHRFGDKVAVWDGQGETVYISAELALKLAETLKDCAESIALVKFSDSAFGTREVTDTDD